MNRRNFLQRTALAGAVLGIRPLTASSAPSETDLLAEARERIRKHRMGSGTIVVRDKAGKAIPGASVKVEQMRHEFLFGCNFFMFGRLRNPDEEQAYREAFRKLLNYATLGFYWGAYEAERGKPNYEYTDKVLEWCRENQITCKGHPLAWDHPASSPKWLPDNTSDVEALSVARVREIVARFKGRINIWDVVNEPTDLTRFKNPMNVFANCLGAVPFTRLHLEAARASNADATLLVNDYRTDDAFCAILDALREKGKRLFDAVGIQSHMHSGGWPLERIWKVCDSYSRLGLPVHFTEATVVSGPRKGTGENWDATTAEGEQRQADYVEKFYTMLFAHPSVAALTWWDFSDRGAWQGAPAGWVRKDMTPKPVYEKLMRLIKGEWWTNASATTDAAGTATLQAFFGSHRLTLTTPDGRTTTQQVQWKKAGPNRFEFQV